MCICLIISNYFPLEGVYNVIYRVEMNFFLNIGITGHKAYALHNSLPNTVSSFRKKQLLNKTVKHEKECFFGN